MNSNGKLYGTFSTASEVLKNRNLLKDFETNRIYAEAIEWVRKLERFAPQVASSNIRAINEALKDETMMNFLEGMENAILDSRDIFSLLLRKGAGTTATKMNLVALEMEKFQKSGSADNIFISRISELLGIVANKLKPKEAKFEEHPVAM
jgi:hypothetical protein